MAAGGKMGMTCLASMLAQTLGVLFLSFRETPTYGGNGAVIAPYHAINIAGTCEKLLISSLSAHIARRLSTQALGGART